MRKRAVISFVIFLSLIGFSQPSASAQRGANLYERFEGKEVQIHIGAIQDETSDKRTDAVHLKSSLEKALSERKSIRFVPVQDARSADLSVEVLVHENYWTDQDPVDMLIGLGAVAMDAAVRENYSLMQATFTVSDPKTGKVLWKDKIKATLSSKDLEKEASVREINEDMAKVFIRACFGKQRTRR